MQQGVNNPTFSGDRVVDPALVVIYSSPGHLYVMFIPADKKNTECERFAIKERDIAELLKLDDDVFWPVLKQMLGKVMQWFESVIHARTRLHFVVHGPARRIPWQQLLSELSTPPEAITTLPSASFLVSLGKTSGMLGNTLTLLSGSGSVLDATAANMEKLFEKRGFRVKRSPLEQRVVCGAGDVVVVVIHGILDQQGALRLVGGVSAKEDSVKIFGAELVILAICSGAHCVEYDSGIVSGLVWDLLINRNKAVIAGPDLLDAQSFVRTVDYFMEKIERLKRSDIAWLETLKIAERKKSAILNWYGSNNLVYKSGNK